MDEVRKLYEAYRLDVFRYLLSLTKDRHLAEELLSDTFLSAIIALPNYRGDGDPKAWLLAIARNKWFDYLRRKRLNFAVEDRIVLDISADPEQHIYNKMILARAMQLLDEEKALNKRVVLMRLQGYSFYEIGQAVNIREGSARVIDFRTRKRLQDRLEQEGFYETV